LSCHSVAVVHTLVQTRQVRINIHKRNNTKNTAQTMQDTVNTSLHITKTPTHTHTHTLQYSHAHITIPTHTHTHSLENKLKRPQHKIHTK